MKHNLNSSRILSSQKVTSRVLQKRNVNVSFGVFKKAKALNRNVLRGPKAEKGIGLFSKVLPLRSIPIPAMKIPFSSIPRIDMHFISVLTACTRILGGACRFFTSIAQTGLGFIALAVFGIMKFFWNILAGWMKLYGMHGVPQLRTRQYRLCGLFGVFILFGCVIVARLVSLQGTEHAKWEAIASKQHRIKNEVAGSRGLITDRNGVELAVSIPSIAVGIHPTWIKDKKKSASELSPLLNIPEQDLMKELSSDRPYLVLARGVSQSREKALKALRIYGLEIEKDYLRIYPQGNMASTIVGKTGRDGFGLSGIERSLDGVLSASSTHYAAKRDARGRHMSAGIWDQNTLLLKNVNANGGVFEGVTNFFSPRIFAENDSLSNSSVRNEGVNIALSIDSAVQAILEEEIDSAKTSSKASQVFGVVMDAHSGEILAMGQTGRFDPNAIGSVSNELLRNVILQNSYEPGSTFKPIVAALALDQGYARYDELINCENGKFKVGKHTIKDVHPVPTVSFEQIIVRSSNIGMVKLGFRMGKDRLYNSLRDFGFGEVSNVGLAGESKGIFRDASRWATVDVATHSFGQGISVTALQMVRAYAAIANGGLLVTPKIMREHVPSGVEKRVLQESTTLKIRKALHLVTEDTHGTGKNSRIPGVPVYGKTGTAQKAKISGKGYDPTKVLASFIGFVDGHSVGVERTLVAYIAVDEPGVTPRWGGTLAAPVFRNVLERTLSHLLSQESAGRTQMARRLGKGNQVL
jgi:cell division protein FtsI (penicillin-binding protein 3)